MNNKGGIVPNKTANPQKPEKPKDPEKQALKGFVTLEAKKSDELKDIKHKLR